MLSCTPRIFVGSTTFAVIGMTCAGCQRAVTAEIFSIDGVGSVSVDLDSGLATVTASHAVDRADIAAAVGRVGYRLVP